jgi:hypothetical protein
MPLLPAPAPHRLRRGRLPLHADRVGRRRLGAVGGVLVEAGLQVLDLLIQLGNLPFQAIDHGPDDGTGLLRKTVPDVLRNRGRAVHAAVVIAQP